MFTGVRSTGSDQQHYCSFLRGWYDNQGIHMPQRTIGTLLRSNRWIHYTVRFSRNTPGPGWHFNLGKFNLWATTAGSPFSPQTDFKFLLRVQGNNINSVQLSNVWAAFEDSVIPDFNEREYVGNFLTPEGKAIELPGDGAVGAITPVVYFKGENNDPLLDSVSQTQATTNAGSVEIFEKDFRVFSPHPLGNALHSFPDDNATSRRLYLAPRQVRPESIYYDAPATDVDRQAAISVFLNTGPYGNPPSTE